jgi:hypothetical protein
VAHHDLDQPRVRMALIRDLDGLPRARPDTADATLSLLGYLGEALLAAGRPGDGRRALELAFTHYRAAAPPWIHERAELIARLLAVDAVRRGDGEAARAWALRSLEVADHPELAADDLLLDPTTQGLAGDPGLERVRQLGRSLDPLESYP